MAHQLPKMVTSTYTQEQIEAIDALFFNGEVSAHDREVCYCVAAALNLNPITGEVMFLPRRQKIKQFGGEKWIEKVEPLVGRDGYLSVANRIKTFNGMETSSEIREMPRLVNGEWTTVKTLVAICKVHRKDTAYPFVAEVVYHEYLQTDKAGKPTRLWQEKPDLMLKKVAESQALRKAFNLHGTYCPEEVGLGYTTPTGKLVPDRESQAFPQKHDLLPHVVTDIEEEACQPEGTTMISETQATKLESLAKEVQADIPKFLEYLRVGKFTDIMVSDLGKAVGLLERKRQKNLKDATARQKKAESTPNEKIAEVMTSLRKRSISFNIQGDLLCAMPPHGDTMAVTLLRGLGFARKGSEWMLSIKQTVGQQLANQIQQQQAA